METKKKVKVYNCYDNDGREEDRMRRKSQRQFSSFPDVIHREWSEETFLKELQLNIYWFTMCLKILPHIPVTLLCWPLMRMLIVNGASWNPEVETVESHTMSCITQDRILMAQDTMWFQANEWNLILLETSFRYDTVMGISNLLSQITQKYTLLVVLVVMQQKWTWPVSIRMRFSPWPLSVGQGFGVAVSCVGLRRG